MASLAPPSVFLDANVLYSAQRRSLFINLGTLRELRVLWSDAVNAEWVDALTARRPDLDRAAHLRVVEHMNKALPAANVTGYEPGIAEFDSLPDPDDRHVAAAARHGQARIILTYDLRHFPASALTPHGLAAVHPDSFLTAFAITNAARLGAAMRNARLVLARSTPSPQAYLDRLSRDGLPQTAALMQRDVDFL